MALLRNAPGKTAIEQLLASQYPQQQPALALATRVRWFEGGPDPLDFVRAFLNPGAPAAGSPPHWHYIGLGLSELYGDEDDEDDDAYAVAPVVRPGRSGAGFELTFRLAVADGEERPPMWPVFMLNSLARYVFSSGTLIGPGHFLMQVTKDCTRRHAIAVLDPQLGRILTPAGVVQFVQLVLVANKDLETAQSWNPASFAEIMRRYPEVGGPLLVADRDRGDSLMDIYPELAAEVDRRLEEEGSIVPFFTSWVVWSPRQALDQPTPIPRVRLVFDVRALSTFVAGLRGRLLHGKGYCMENEAALEGELAHAGAPRCRVLFVTNGVTEFPAWDGIHASASEPFVRLSGDCELEIYISADQARRLAASLSTNAIGTDLELPRLFVFPDILPGLEIQLEDDVAMKRLCRTPATTEEVEQFVRSRFPHDSD